MENKKISIQELTDVIAAHSNSSKRFTESFLRELVLVIQEYLEKDGVVKVKGLGTFKLIWNEPRKSVDVSTGDTIVLPGHYKVSFTADAVVKQLINRPYAHLDTVIGEAQVISEVQEHEELIVEHEENGDDKVGLRVEKGEMVEDKGELRVEKEEISEAPETPIVTEPQKVVSPTKKKWWVVMVILILLCLLGAAGYYYRNVFIPQQNTLLPSDIKAPVVVVRVDTAEQVVADTIEMVEEVVTDTVVAPEITLDTYTYQDALNAPVREIVTVIDGSRLTMVAYRAFGHKAFWVYVYDANRKVLQSPNAVEKGMQLVIPDLPLSIVNPKSQLCIDKALELAKQY